MRSFPWGFVLPWQLGLPVSPRLMAGAAPQGGPAMAFSSDQPRMCGWCLCPRWRAAPRRLGGVWPAGPWGWRWMWTLVMSDAGPAPAWEVAGPWGAAAPSGSALPLGLAWAGAAAPSFPASASLSLSLSLSAVVGARGAATGRKPNGCLPSGRSSKGHPWVFVPEPPPLAPWWHCRHSRLDPVKLVPQLFYELLG